jgi:hypothetical protein
LKYDLIIIDPGHGGQDPGAVGELQEAKENALAAQILSGLLTQNGIANIVYVVNRAHDANTSLSDRSAWANRNVGGKRAVYISLHLNSAPSGTGVECWVYKSNDDRELASKICANLSRRLNIPNRGVKSSNFSVLRKTTMPAVLVETCFVNPPDSNGYRARGGAKVTAEEIYYALTGKAPSTTPTIAPESKETRAEKNTPINTLTFTVVHSPYFFTLRNGDPLLDFNNKLWFVDQLKISGGEGMVTTIEVTCVEADEEIGTFIGGWRSLTENQLFEQLI